MKKWYEIILLHFEEGVCNGKGKAYFGICK